MLSRVVRPETTTYLHDYNRKEGPYKLAENLSLTLTTGNSHCATRRALYKTDYHDTAVAHKYARTRSFKMDLLELPPEYRSSAKANLSSDTGVTDYTHYYGRLGQRATAKRSVARPRSLSRQTRAFVHGTTRATHHPPLYDGAIPSEWPGNLGKCPHADRSVEDITWQFHTEKTGYMGYVASPDMAAAVQRTGLKRASTTYRDMCDELGYTVT
jgi:hypothetical protein